MKSKPTLRSARGFTAVELIVALVLFSAATSGVLLMSKAMRDHRTAALSATERNAYATFQSQVALQGIDPSLVGNPLAGSIETPGTVGNAVALGTASGSMQIVRNRLAAFEVAAVTDATFAQSDNFAATVNAINYDVAPSGMQATRGAGIGFAILTVGQTTQAGGIPLAPPSFNLPNDLTAAPFPLNDIATLPASNPPGTQYRYTLDGSAPTATSLLWDNDPSWTPQTFPARVTLAAFPPPDTGQQYIPSVPVTQTFTMQLEVLFSRADGRTANLYGFTLADLVSAPATGIVLTTNVAGYGIFYTLDGSEPDSSSTPYEAAFVPLQSQFTPTVLLKVMATNSSDPRIIPTTVVGYTLSTLTAPLTPPTFITDNSQPLPPGTDVQISVSGSATPRTEVNNGAPTQSSSSATSFPIN